MTVRVLVWIILLTAGGLSGCASLPPGAHFQKRVSTVLAQPALTPLGAKFDTIASRHDGNSGFRIIPVGADGFLIRMQMINAATRTLDLQYFIFHQDNTGRLLTDAVLRAADHGVRVRVLIDDGEMRAGDDQVLALTAHPLIQIRIFNPFAYRGHNPLLRSLNFVTDAERLDYRMHNKLLVVDNTLALVGGRNIGDRYFQIDPDSQVADDDVFVAGPLTQQLSATFDDYWNSDMAIPVEALSPEKTSLAALIQFRSELNEHNSQLKDDGFDYVKRLASGEPFNGIMSGALPLTWAHAQVVCDSPDKKEVEEGKMGGSLMQRPVEEAVLGTHSELLMITPYLIPGKDGMRIFKTLRQRKVRIRVLTNSLSSTPVLLAQAGFMHYRIPMLEEGIQLYEIRSLLGNARGSGETKAISRYGNYSLHAKLYVFDRKKVFIGSMNFDQRSLHLNTEIGLIIDSPALAQQIAARFNEMVLPVNAYQLILQPDNTGTPRLLWRTSEDGKTVEYETEPARSAWQRFKADCLSLLPLDKEL